MEFAIFVLVIAGLVAARIAYGKMLEQGMRTRIVETSLSPDALSQIFVQKVVGSTWKLVDDDPMVAQSPLISGIRQQIYLEIVSLPTGRTRAVVGVARWSMNRGIPAKAHTIRMRLDAFERAVRGQDPAVGIETRGLRVEVGAGAPTLDPAVRPPDPGLPAQDPWSQLERVVVDDADLGADWGSRVDEIGGDDAGGYDVLPPTAPPPQAPALAAGWYLDPLGSGLRWWDGSAWTDATSPVAS